LLAVQQGVVVPAIFNAPENICLEALAYESILPLSESDQHSSPEVIRDDSTAMSLWDDCAIQCLLDNSAIILWKLREWKRIKEFF
jgi:hypothetical protein